MLPAARSIRLAQEWISSYQATEDGWTRAVGDQVPLFSQTRLAYTPGAPWGQRSLGHWDVFEDGGSQQLLGTLPADR